jgi:hypothetical protein
MTRRISQATLNTYLDYNNPTNPTAVGMRQLQLSTELEGSVKKVETFVDILEHSIPGAPR